MTTHTVQRFTAVAVLVLSMAACGKTSGMRGSGAEGDGNRNDDAGASGSGPGDSDAAAGAPGGGGEGGMGSAGEGGTGATGAGGAGAPGTGGFASGTGGVTSNGGVASRLDPNTQERREAVTSYCALLESYPCLSYPSLRDGAAQTRDQMIAACRQEQEVLQSSFWGDACFGEWRDALECYTSGPWTCPCEGNGCFLSTPGQRPHPFEGLCAEYEDALSSCLDASQETDTVTGASGECSYHWSTLSGCLVQCDRNFNLLESDCMGPLGGAQRCTCELNGLDLRDSALDSTVFWADDCIGVAQIMADGFCDRITDCCFTWEKDGTPLCSCTADPTTGGFDSCEAAAAAGGGEVVDLCPQYTVPWGEFPEP